MGWFLASEQSMAATPTAPCHPVERIKEDSFYIHVDSSYIKLLVILVHVHVHLSSLEY